MSTDFLLERKQINEAPELHQRVKDSVFVLQNMLEGFLPRFPDFTDHSILHSMDVLDYSNRLLGAEQIEKLSPGECYVLIMACYLHDIGMGDSIILRVKPKAPEYVSLLETLNGKIQHTLDYCRSAAEERSDLRITQKQSVLIYD